MRKTQRIYVQGTESGFAGVPPMPYANTIRKLLPLLKHSVFLATITSSFAQTPTFTETPVFVSGQGGYNTYRIPALVRSTDGTLLAFCEGRKLSSSDSSDIDIVMRRSTDGGQTWGPMTLVQEEGGNAPITIGNPAPVVDETTGNIYLFFCRNNDRAFYTVSTDNGVSWSIRTEVTSAVKLNTWTWYATGPGHGVQLKRGAQAGRLVIPCDHFLGTTTGVHAIYSDDHGASWKLGAVAEATPEIYPNENQCVELVAPAQAGGSSLYFNARKLGTAGTSPCERADSSSINGGLTYSRPFIYRPDLVCPVTNGGVEGSLMRLRAKDEGSNTNRILFSSSNDPGSRVRLSIWSSSDEGTSWSTPKAVYDGPSAYSDMARINSSEMALLYEKGVASPYETITFAHFNESWLDVPTPPGPLAEDPKPAFWNFEEKPSAQLASTNPDAIRDIQSPGYSLNLTALKAFVYVPGSPNYGSGVALAFNGTGGLRLSDAASSNHLDFAANNSFTLETVFRIPVGSTQIGSLMAKDLGGNLPSWWLRVNNGTLQFFVGDYGHQTLMNTTNPVNDGQWHHVAAVRDASSSNKILRLYLDGVLIKSMADATTGTLANSLPFNVGCFNNDAARNLTGDIDMVRITPSVLTSQNFLKPTSQFEVQIAVAQGIALTDGASNISTGTVNVGDSSQPTTFTITNPGALNLTNLAVTIDGADAADFTVSPLSSTSIAAGTGSATFAVTFSPTAGSPSRTAILHVTSNASGTSNPFDIILSGTANTPPTDVALSQAILLENVAANTIVGVFRTTDPNADNNFSYSLVNGSDSTDNEAFTITNAELKINSPPLLAAKGSYTIRVRTTDPGGLFLEKTFVISVLSGGVTFTDWAASIGLAESDAMPDATPFHDGIQNLLKYAFNMNAKGPDASILSESSNSGLPRTTVNGTGEQPVLRVEFLRRKGVGLIYTAQRATSLADFEPMDGTETVTSIDAQWERVSIEAPFQPADAPRAFVRLQVSQP